MKNYMRLLIPLLLLAACDSNEPIIEVPADLQLVTALPAPLLEASGLERANDGVWWAQNDGGPALFYAFNEGGSLLRTLKLAPADNVDWEDLAIDGAGALYVGDFGNNDNDRQDLRIYKIPAPASITTDEVAPEIINFTLADQTAFPPPAAERRFDLEAMFVRNNAILLFTRDRTEPFSGKTQLYRLPNAPGTHVAERLGEFVTDADAGQGAITSADISPDGSRMALLANQMLYVFENFSGDAYFDGEVTRFTLTNRQYEGVVFADNRTLFLCTEGLSGQAGNLWRVNLP